MTLPLRVRAAALQAEFEALPIEADGWIRVPPALRRKIIDLALDVMTSGSERAKAATPKILAMLTRKSAR